jgi:hypothetical protein
MSEPTPEPEPSNPQDFLGDLDIPVFQIVEKDENQSGIEYRDGNANE